MTRKAIVVYATCVVALVVMYTYTLRDLYVYFYEHGTEEGGPTSYLVFAFLALVLPWVLAPLGSSHTMTAGVKCKAIMVLFAYGIFTFVIGFIYQRGIMNYFLNSDDYVTKVLVRIVGKWHGLYMYSRQRL
jgi:hypothetical protein